MDMNEGLGTAAGTEVGNRVVRKSGNDFSIKLCQMGQMGLLPTPRACESIERRNMKTIVDKVENGGDVTLTTLAKYKGGIMLPTPRETAARDNSIRDSGKGNLEDVIAKLLPTPATRDWKGARSTEALEESGRNETNSLPDAFAQTGKTSQLSPLFVEEMMGYPITWLVSPFQSGETKV